MHLSHIQKSWVELGSAPIRGDVDILNVDLFGRAVLSDHAIQVQQLWVEQGSAPMRAKVEKPLHTWAGQVLVWLTCFGGLAASLQQGIHQNPRNINLLVCRVCLGRFLGGGSQTRGWRPLAAARTGPLPSGMDRCMFECADVR